MEDRKLFTDQAELLLKVLNRQRHDWLNHIQVLLGHLKLGRPEAGEAYLKRVTEESHQESTIARINCPPLSVFFLTFNALHHDLRLDVKVCPPVDLARLQMDRGELFDLVTDLVFAVKGHLQPFEGETPHLQVSLNSGDRDVYIRFHFAGRLDESARERLEMLAERSERSGAAIVRRMHGSGEWEMELRFPCHT